MTGSEKGRMARAMEGLGRKEDKRLGVYWRGMFWAGDGSGLFDMHPQFFPLRTEDSLPHVWGGCYKMALVVSPLWRWLLLKRATAPEVTSLLGVSYIQ